MNEIPSLMNNWDITVIQVYLNLSYASQISSLAVTHRSAISLMTFMLISIMARKTFYCLGKRRWVKLISHPWHQDARQLHDSRSHLMSSHLIPSSHTLITPKTLFSVLESHKYSRLRLVRSHQNKNFLYELSIVPNYQYDEICLN